MSREREIELLHLAKRPDTTDPARKEARDTILFHHMAMVLKQATIYAETYKVEQTLLVTNGIEGLYHAIDKYNFERGINARFCTYATWWIRQHIQKAAPQLYMIKLNEKLLKTRRKLYKQFKAENGRTPTPAEQRTLYINAGIDTNTATALVQSRSLSVNTDYLINSSDHHEYNTSAIKDSVNTYLSKLRPDISEVLRARFGIEPYNREYTLDEIAHPLNTSKEWIRQLQLEGMHQINKFHHGMENGTWQHTCLAKHHAGFIARSKLIRESLVREQCPSALQHA